MHMRNLVWIAAAALVGCSESGSDIGSKEQPARPAQTSSETGPAWLLASEPADVMDVGMVKASAREGDEVSMIGRIGGRVEPMVEGRAVFTIVDSAVPSCLDTKDDDCPTPWDYCCEPRDSLLANSATVQLVDEAGKPLAIDLTAHGFKPLDEVVVVGAVGPRPSDAVLVIKASKLGRPRG